MKEEERGKRGIYEHSAQLSRLFNPSFTQQPHNGLEMLIANTYNYSSMTLYI